MKQAAPGLDRLCWRDLLFLGGVPLATLTSRRRDTAFRSESLAALVAVKLWRDLQTLVLAVLVDFDEVLLDSLAGQEGLDLLSNLVPGNRDGVLGADVVDA